MTDRDLTILMWGMIIGMVATIAIRYAVRLMGWLWGCDG